MSINFASIKIRFVGK